MVERFHKAAQDGYLELLKEATRRDCNTKDEDGMTPTLWAAFEGHLDALRLLLGRGGDPEKCDNYGNTALHLAAAKGHLSCVTFLVNFGVSIWDLDIDFHTAKDLAAINNKEDILKYLDSAISKQEASNPKTAKSQQEKARKEAEKRIKNFQKLQKKAEKLASKDDEILEKERRRMSLVPSTTEGAAKDRRPSLGAALLGTVGRRDSRLIAQQQGTLRYSDMVGGGGTVNSRKLKGGVFKKIVAAKAANGGGGGGFDFTVRDTTMDGNRTVRSLAGLRRDSEVMFLDKGALGSLDNEDLSSGFERPDFISEPSSIFNRPGFGSMAFRNSISAFNHLSLSDQNEDDRQEDSIGSAGSLAQRNERNSDRIEDIWEEEDSDPSDTEDAGKEFTSVQMFLAATGLTDWIPVFLKERIDLDSLMLLTESDLADALGMPLGPRKKLLKAVEIRRADMEEPDALTDSRL